MHTTDDRPNLADKLLFYLTRPETLGRILRWAWLISLFMLVMGYLIIYFKIRTYF